VETVGYETYSGIRIFVTVRLILIVTQNPESGIRIPDFGCFFFAVHILIEAKIRNPEFGFLFRSRLSLVFQNPKV
jgi:hypothetical protein